MRKGKKDGVEVGMGYDDERELKGDDVGGEGGLPSTAHAQ